MRTLIAAGGLALALAAFPAMADDANGKFMIKGIGSKTCQDLLRNNGVTREQLDVFLDGFVTALNIEKSDTYDIVPAAEWDPACATRHGSTATPTSRFSRQSHRAERTECRLGGARCLNCKPGS